MPPKGVSASRDGGFVITGNSKSSDLDVSNNAGENDVWLIKTDAFGNLVWQKNFGGSRIDFGFDAVENIDKSILLVGETSSTDFLGLQPKGKSDIVVVKIK